LINLEHEAIRVSNILHRITKKTLPLFRIDLKAADNNSNILKLYLLLHTRIKIELLKKNLSPPQCHDCQAYYHTTVLVIFATSRHVASNVEITITLQNVPNHRQNPPSVPYARGRTQTHTKGVQCLRNLVKTAENPQNLSLSGAQSQHTVYKQINFQLQSEAKTFLCQYYCQHFTHNSYAWKSNF